MLILVNQNHSDIMIHKQQRPRLQGMDIVSNTDNSLVDVYKCCVLKDHMITLEGFKIKSIDRSLHGLYY